MMKKPKSEFRKQAWAILILFKLLGKRHMTPRTKILHELYAEDDLGVTEYLAINLHSLCYERLNQDEPESPEQALYRERLCLDLQITEDVYLDLISRSFKRKVEVSNFSADEIRMLSRHLADDLQVQEIPRITNFVQENFTRFFDAALAHFSQMRVPLEQTIHCRLYWKESIEEVACRLKKRLGANLLQLAETRKS